MMRQRKGKKILLYFFLLMIVGSINNVSLKDFKFEKIKYIQITGLNNFYKEKILSDIKNLKLENIFFIKKKELTKIINSNNLVENYKVFKKYPSTLDITIQETTQIAKIKIKGKNFYIGTNGKFSEKKFSNKELPFIFGRPSVQQFLEFKKNIDQSKFSYEDIKRFYFFPSNRWDIELSNKIIVKLPRDNIRKSLDETFGFLNSHSVNDIKIIDARVKNQIILND